MFLPQSGVIMTSIEEKLDLQLQLLMLSQQGRHRGIGNSIASIQTESRKSKRIITAQLVGKITEKANYHQNYKMQRTLFAVVSSFHALDKQGLQFCFLKNPHRQRPVNRMHLSQKGGNFATKRHRENGANEQGLPGNHHLNM